MNNLAENGLQPGEIKKILEEVGGESLQEDPAAAVKSFFVSNVEGAGSFFPLRPDNVAGAFFFGVEEKRRAISNVIGIGDIVAEGKGERDSIIYAARLLESATVQDDGRRNVVNAAAAEKFIEANKQVTLNNLKQWVVRWAWCSVHAKYMPPGVGGSRRHRKSRKQKKSRKQGKSKSRRKSKKLYGGDGTDEDRESFDDLKEKLVDFALDIATLETHQQQDYVTAIFNTISNYPPYITDQQKEELRNVFISTLPWRIQRAAPPTLSFPSSTSPAATV